MFSLDIFVEHILNEVNLPSSSGNPGHILFCCMNLSQASTVSAYSEVLVLEGAGDISVLTAARMRFPSRGLWTPLGATGAPWGALTASFDDVL